MNPLERDDPTFADDLRESQRTVWLVANWLSRKGHHVTVRALRLRPTIADIHDYGDEGDLEIVERIEVKRRQLDFTSAADYPYPTVTVDVAHTFDRASPKPKCYVILNKAATVAAIVHRSTSRQWTRVTKHDRFKHRDRTFYECPLALVQFARMVD